ncbi:40-kDa huntingtin-associated protein-like [Corticium candelabrum]|uniref:40-kDa huntingtin-associated protein-like n=1 Tax=Corticium candelabrum TaxID=121492 RepID=UPI002E272440|nr:40-kDa huntingtin-associated protein-like [Corticium candelabrum]
MNPNEDVLGAYRDITGRLKKRLFSKKISASQASEELSALGRRLNNQTAYPYAAFCSQAVARCEREAGNEQREVEAMTDAARRYMKSVKENRRLGMLSLQEDCVSSIQCYRSAISLYIAQGQQILAGSLAVEVADVVCCDLENFQQAVPFYRQAVELLGQNSSQLLCAMRKLASCYIKSNDLESALNCFTDIMDVVVKRNKLSGGSSDEAKVVELCSSFVDTMRWSEVSVIFLVLTLRPLGYSESKSKYAQVFDKYRNWDPLNPVLPVNYITDDLFMYLNAVILTAEAKDVLALRELQKELVPQLPVEQNHLLLVLLKSISQ